MHRTNTYVLVTRDRYIKVKPLYSDFIKFSHTYLAPEWNVLVNKQLILFKGCFKHSINIGTKATEHDFKIYSLCAENYLYNFLFTSKKSKISLLEQRKELADSSSVVLRLVKSLSKLYNYVIYMNNFFINARLYMALKKLEIEVCETAKNESEFSVKLLTLQEILMKKNNWEKKAYSTVKEVLCLTWQDNNTVQLMSTVHSFSDFKVCDLVSKIRYHGISAESVIIRVKTSSFYGLLSVYAHSQSYIKHGLLFSTAVWQYNWHIRGSDSNT